MMEMERRNYEPPCIVSLVKSKLASALKVGRTWLFCLGRIKKKHINLISEFIFHMAKRVKQDILVL